MINTSVKLSVSNYHLRTFSFNLSAQTLSFKLSVPKLAVSNCQIQTISVTLSVSNSRFQTFRVKLSASNPQFRTLSCKPSVSNPQCQSSCFKLPVSNYQDKTISFKRAESHPQFQSRWSSVGWNFGRPSDLGGMFWTNLFAELLVRAYILWVAHWFLHKSLKIKPVIQRRLEPLQAIKFGRYVLNEIVRRACSESIHTVLCVAYCFSPLIFYINPWE